MSATYQPYALRFDPGRRHLESASDQYASDRLRNARLDERLPGLRSKHYTGRLLDALDYIGIKNQDELTAALSAWEASSPRPRHREFVLAADETAWRNDEAVNWIFHGSLSGTGKTTAGFEVVLRQAMNDTGRLLHGNWFDDDPSFDHNELPLLVTGIRFAAECGRLAKECKLGEFIESLVTPEVLLLDDLDKRSTAAGMFSPSTQQALYEIIEARTSDDQKQTILTCNRDGEGFAEAFDLDIACYLMRRIRERFTSLDFDPPSL